MLVADAFKGVKDQVGHFGLNALVQVCALGVMQTFVDLRLFQKAHGLPAIPGMKQARAPHESRFSAATVHGCFFPSKNKCGSCRCGDPG